MQQSQSSPRGNQIEKLAAMECFASCLMTCLRLSGLDPRYFLINYWNLNYRFHTLLSGRNPRLLALEEIYGAKLEFRGGDHGELLKFLRRRSRILYLCRASELPFFPSNMLGHEELGFDHIVLLEGYDDVRDETWVADPIADYHGTVPIDALLRASIKPNSFYYYVYSEPPQGYGLPNPQQIFAHATRRNLLLFEESTLHGGRKAIELFATDLAASMDWDRTQRMNWIEKNNVTITSIINTRTKVWQSFVELSVITVEQSAELKRCVDEIIKLWTGVNFMLVKYRSRSEQTVLDKTLNLVQKIEVQEQLFLRRMVQIGSEWT